MLHLRADVEALILRALQEDLNTGDPTTEALVSEDLRSVGTVVAKAPGVLCGVEVALEVFRHLDPSLELQALLQDGASIQPKAVIAQVRGHAGSILKGERTALNLLQHLSGIATETSRYVEAVKGFKARIVDTRKTLPGLRTLQKYAVRVGGGSNHRRSLGDGILIKDNHIALLRARGLTLGEVVRCALAHAPHTLKVEVEVTSLQEAEEALDVGAQLLLLDNMGLAEMMQVVALARGRALLEASGGINLETVRAVAATGVDLISVGALTHSARALDISMDIEGS